MDLKRLIEPEADRFRALCNFSEEERRVFDLRVKDKQVVEISMALGMAESTVKRRLRRIQDKVERVSHI